MTFVISEGLGKRDVELEIGKVRIYSVCIESDLFLLIQGEAAEKGVENGVNHLNRLIEEGKIVKEYRIVEK